MYSEEYDQVRQSYVLFCIFHLKYSKYHVVVCVIKTIFYFQAYEYSYGGDYEPHTGDPHLDIEYDRQYYKMPEMVKKFLTYFRNVISEGLIFEIQNLYENSFPKLTEQYFEKRPWPDEEEVAKIVDNDPVSMLSFISFVLFSVNQR